MNRYHSLRIAFAVFVACALSATSARAYLVFSEDFDADAVGTFPSTWVLTTGSSAEKYVTNNLFSSAPNSFQIGNPHNLNYEAARFFPTQNLASIVANGFDTLQLGYSMAVPIISDGSLDGNAGWLIMLGLGSPFGFTHTFNGGWLRVFSDAGTTNSWRIFSPLDGVVLTNNLPLNSFFDVFIEIKPTPGNETQGTIEYRLNGVSLGTFAYNSPNININGLRVNAQTGLGNDTPYFFHLDNVFVNVIPEPSAAALALVGAASLAMLRRRRAAS